MSLPSQQPTSALTLHPYNQKEYWKDPSLRDTIIGPIEEDHQSTKIDTHSIECNYQENIIKSSDDIQQLRDGAFRTTWQPLRQYGRARNPSKTIEKLSSDNNTDNESIHCNSHDVHPDNQQTFLSSYNWTHTKVNNSAAAQSSMPSATAIIMRDKEFLAPTQAFLTRDPSIALPSSFRFASNAQYHQPQHPSSYWSWLKRSSDPTSSVQNQVRQEGSRGSALSVIYSWIHSFRNFFRTPNLGSSLNSSSAIQSTPFSTTYNPLSSFDSCPSQNPNSSSLHSCPNQSHKPSCRATPSIVPFRRCPPEISVHYSDSNISFIRKYHLFSLLLSLIVTTLIVDLVLSAIFAPVNYSISNDQTFRIVMLFVFLIVYYVEVFTSSTRRLLSLLPNCPTINDVVWRIKNQAPVIIFGVSCWHVSRVDSEKFISGQSQRCLHQHRVDGFTKTEAFDFGHCRDASDTPPLTSWFEDFQPRSKFKRRGIAEIPIPEIHDSLVQSSSHSSPQFSSDVYTTGVIILDIRLSYHLLELDTVDRVNDLRERLRDSCRHKDDYFDEQQWITLPGLPQEITSNSSNGIGSNNQNNQMFMVAPLICRTVEPTNRDQNRPIDRIPFSSSLIRHDGAQWFSLTVYLIMSFLLLSWPYRIFLDAYVMRESWNVRKIVSVHEDMDSSIEEEIQNRGECPVVQNDSIHQSFNPFADENENKKINKDSSSWRRDVPIVQLDTEDHKDVSLKLVSG